MPARRSPCSRSKRRRHFSCSRVIRRTLRFLKSDSAAGLTPPTWSSGRSRASSPACRSITASFSATRSSRSPRKKPASSSRTCRRSYASQAREALAVIERQAARVRAPLSIAGEEWTATEERGRLVYQDGDGLLDLPAPKLYGRHQFENAGAAIAALRVGGLKLPAAAFEAGMTRVDWPARMQRLSQGRLTALHSAGERAVARRRPQRRRRARHRRGAGRSGGARVAAACAHRRHAVDQGLRRLSEKFFRARPPRHHCSHSAGQGGAGRRPRRYRARCGAFRRSPATISKAPSTSPASSISNRRRAS